MVKSLHQVMETTMPLESALYVTAVIALFGTFMTTLAVTTFRCRDLPR